MSPINDREKFKEIIKNNLEGKGAKTNDNFLALTMKKGQITDGEQNIDDFVKNIIKNG